MKFSGYWVSAKDEVVTALPDIFDETDLTAESSWTEAHQNEEPTYPAGYVDPARILAETGMKLLEVNPDLAKVVAKFENQEMEIRNAEDFGLFCLSQIAWLADRARRAAKLRAMPVPDQSRNDEIPFN